MSGAYSEHLGLGSGDVVAMIGSGGKTSLLFRLATENRGRRVLVSTTTKMFWPTPGEYDWDISHEGGCTRSACTGIHLLHSGAAGEKMAAPSMERLAAASAEAELSLLECDGSRCLPLKGWADYEPVVPDFVTMTVGVLPLWALGVSVGPEQVHRVAQFCRLTGALPGESVTLGHLAAVVGHPEGLFHRAQGRRALFLNYQTECEHLAWKEPPCGAGAAEYLVSDAKYTPPNLMNPTFSPLSHTGTRSSAKKFFACSEKGGGGEGELNIEKAEALAEALDPAVRKGLTILAGDVHNGTVRRIGE